MGATVQGNHWAAMALSALLLLAVAAQAAPEAEPEAKADPYLLYGGYYGHGLGYGYGYGYPYTYGYYGKREAEAKPAVVAPVVGYPYAALPYAAPAVVPATHSITYKTYTPTVETNVVGTNAAVTHTLGEPIVNEHTAVVPTLAYYGKRFADAEAEADPYLLYGGYYGHAYGYGYPYAYGHYGYYGKRSADAEPKADADPYLLYGGYYGHAYGYGYPYAY